MDSKWEVTNFIKEVVFAKGIKKHGNNTDVFNARVRVIEDNLLKFEFDNIEIKFEEKYLDINVNIFWDNYLKNYLRHKLFGYYSTKFCKMSYDKNKSELIIIDSNKNQIVLGV